MSKHENDSEHAVYERGLKRAQRLGDEAAAWGFDWPDVSGALAKIDEELVELRQEVGESPRSHERTREELGDLFFALVNVARHLDIDAFDAMERANQKFERRIASLRNLAGREGQRPEDLSLDELEALWQKAKGLPGLDSQNSSDL